MDFLGILAHGTRFCNIKKNEQGVWTVFETLSPEGLFSVNTELLISKCRTEKTQSYTWLSKYSGLEKTFHNRGKEEVRGRRT